uniref:ARID domain-containing protein n=2 Tax=Mesocestoides corti TaxID=53468 RepID=A0A5K3G2V0_MESCO
NVLLQLLADAVNKGVDNAACVSKALGLKQIVDENPPKAEKREKKKEPATSRLDTSQDLSKRVAGYSRKRMPTSTRSRERLGRSREVLKVKNDDSPKNNLHESQVPKGKEESLVESKHAAEISSNILESKQPPTPSSPHPEIVADAKVPLPTATPIEGTLSPPLLSRPSRPPSPKDTIKPAEELLQTEIPTIVEHPTKQTPGRIPMTTNPSDSSTNLGVSNGQVRNQMYSGPVISSVAGIMMENEALSDDDDAFIEEETVTGVQLLRAGGENNLIDDGESKENHGGLVTKLLQSKKELSVGDTTAPAGAKLSVRTYAIVWLYLMKQRKNGNESPSNAKWKGFVRIYKTSLGRHFLWAS